VSRLATFFALLTVAAALFLWLPLHVVADGEIEVHIDDVDDSAFPLVRAFMRVDRGGRPLGTVNPTQLAASETGSGATVETVSSVVDSDVPLGLIIVVDVSGSMAGAPIDSAKSSAAALIGRLAATDGAALVTFADTVSVVQPMTRDKGALLAAINGISAAGNTSLYRAVGTASQVAAESAYQRRAVVLLSDGREDGGQPGTTREQSIAAASAARVVFYSIGFGQNVDRPYLEEVSQKSGGAFFAAPTVQQMATVFGSIEAALRNQFVVTLRSAARADQTDRTIGITVTTTDGNGRAQRDYASRRTIRSGSQSAPESPLPGTRSPEPSQMPDRGVAVLGVSLAAVLVGLIGLGTWVRHTVRARARRRTIEALAAPDSRVLPAPVLEISAEAVAPAWLTVISGPHAGSSVVVGTTPLTVGSDPDCGLSLSAHPAVGAHHLRIWRREGRTMLHHLDPRTVTTVNARNVDWAAVAEGDEIMVGPNLLRYDASSGPHADHGAAGNGDSQ
jgi:Mg-chelatase subunit ChlD